MDALTGSEVVGVLRAVRVERVREAEAAGVGLYRLVASATLPPANQVRDKHKDD